MTRGIFRWKEVGVVSLDVSQNRLEQVYVNLI